VGDFIFMSNSQEVSRLAKDVQRLGWTVEKTNGGHLRWTAPSGEFFFSAQTPGDYRVIKKIKVRIKQALAGRSIRR